MFLKKFKDKLIKKALKDDPAMIAWFNKIFPPLFKVVYSIGMFMGLMFIFFRVYDRIGFHKTIMIMFISVMVYFRAYFKSKELQDGY